MVSLYIIQEYAQLLQQREKEKLKRERQRRLQKRIERERRELEKIEREQHQGREPEEKPRQDYGEKFYVSVSFLYPALQYFEQRNQLILQSFH